MNHLRIKVITEPTTRRAVEGTAEISFAAITDANQIARVTLLGLHPVGSAAVSINAFLLLANTDVTHRGEKVFVSSTSQTKIYLTSPFVRFVTDTFFPAKNYHL